MEFRLQAESCKDLRFCLKAELHSWRSGSHHY
jgi:hypothetical protein